VAARGKKKSSTRAAKRPKASRVEPSAKRGRSPREGDGRRGSLETSASTRKRPSGRAAPIGSPSGRKKVERTNWSKVRSPGRGDVDRALYERSATFKRRSEAARKGRKTRASLLSIDLEKEWAKLKALKAAGRGDLAHRRYAKNFLKLEEKIRRVGGKIYAATMARINRDVGGARGAWRDYGKGSRRKR
jgi:hypothetical protein